VDSIVYRKEEGGFTVMDLDHDGELLTVVGELPFVQPGEEVTLTGTFVSHPTFGPQFKAEICERRLPATEAAITKYLGGGVVKGVGPALAKRIVHKFGKDALDIIEKEPERLAEIKGISEQSAQEIAAGFRQAFGIRSMMAQLQKYGLDPTVCVAVWKKWGPDSARVIEENPYELCSQDIGMEFPQVDTIFGGQEGGAAEKRLAAGICFVLVHNLQNGHTCLPQDKLLGAAATLLGRGELDGVLEELLAEHRLDSATVDGRVYIYLPEYFEAETAEAGRLKMMLSLNAPTDAPLDTPIQLLEQELGIEYDETQKNAIRGALENHVFVMTGGPGTGKTTTLNAIIRLLEEQGDRVLLAAPTGRAAKRLSEVTGREAKTLHRLLEVESRGAGQMGTFRRNEKNPLKCDTLIIDEMSMVDTMLFYAVLKALTFSARLIMVGDSDQLPSVGAGNVLGDILAADMLPSVTLDTIFRQAAESMIVTNAHDIVQGEYPELEAHDNDFFFLPRANISDAAKTVVQLCTRRLPSAYGFSPQWDIQVLCPGKRGDLGTWSLNAALQAVLNPADGKKRELKYSGGVLREGDKVMQVRNNYDTTWTKDDGEMGSGVFNGDIGMIKSMDPRSRVIEVRFDDRTAQYTYDSAGELEHAWAVTVHKSQGSEFEAVVLPLFEENPRLCYRNLLYTAVTRARQLLIIVGDQRSIMRMVDNNRRTVRYTNLRRFLEDTEI